MAVVTLTTPNLDYATKQLRWIARGIPELARNSIFRWRMKSRLLLSNNFTKTDEDLQTFYMAQPTPYDFESRVYADVTSKFSNNNYQTGYFHGFFYDNCEWKTEIYGKDLDIIDTTLTLVVLPEDVDDDIDGTTGYFINASNNLDSVVIDDNNIDDYYIWIVRASAQCLKKVSTLNRPCDEDGKCEPWLGETPQNCSDCAGALTDFSNKALFLVSITTQTDFKNKSNNWPESRHQESSWSGDYEMQFTYDVYNAVADKGNFLWRPNNSGTYSIFDETNAAANPRDVMLDIYGARGNNCEVRKERKKNNGSYVSNRGAHTTITYNSPMSFFFIPGIDTISFTLTEADYGSDCGACIGEFPLQGGPLKLLPITSRPFHYWQMRKKHYTKYAYTSTNGIEGPIKVPAVLANWTPGPTLFGKAAWYQSFTLDGEMTVTLAYTNN